MSDLVIHDIDEERVTGLLGLLGGDVRGRSRAGTADPTGFDLVVNATPLGMDGGDALPVNPTVLAPGMMSVTSSPGTAPLP